MTDNNKRTGRPGDRALDKQKVVSFTHLHDTQILCGDATVTHVAGHSHVLKNATREQTLTDRTTATMPAFRAVRHVAARKLVPSHDALKSLALTGADYIDILTRLKL